MDKARDIAQEVTAVGGRSARPGWEGRGRGGYGGVDVGFGGALVCGCLARAGRVEDVGVVDYEGNHFVSRVGAEEKNECAQGWLAGFKRLHGEA